MNEQTKTQYYLEKFRDKLAEVENKRIFDKRIYTILDIPDSTFSRYIRGERAMPDDIAIKVADYLHLERMEVIAEIHKETASSEAEKEFWGKELRRLVGSFAAIGLISGLTMAPTEKANASISIDTQQSIYYTNIIIQYINNYKYHNN